MLLRRPDYIISYKHAKAICDVGCAGKRIIKNGDFRSQNEYNYRRAERVANIINDKFELEHFSGKRILEIGPGHYAFALIARELGAEVVCLERDPSFIKLGILLGFEVLEVDYNELTLGYFNEKFDGLWIKGTFNACNYSNEVDIFRVAEALTSVIKEGGWGWFAVVNKVQGNQNDSNHFLRERIDTQRRALEKNEWHATLIKDAERPIYSLKYSGSPYLYTKNISAYTLVDKKYSNNVNADQAETKASWEGPFTKVQKIWKPTSEYYTNPWQYYVDFINILKDRKVRFITMSQALSGGFDSSEINVILDHHIDFYPVETEVMTRWELMNGVISNIYLFNVFNYADTAQKRKWVIEDLNIPYYQMLENNGFEIGYHQNALGQIRNERIGRIYTREISEEDRLLAHQVFHNDLINLRKYFNIRTMIPHGAGEGNAQLIDLPDDDNNIIWVYNNAKKSGLCSPPLKWMNYSDSCGISSQIIKTKNAQYICHRDNLHLNAHLLKPGLNHILVHAGRFAKGMPYELYENNHNIPINDRYQSVKNEFNLAESILPLSASKLVKDWHNRQNSKTKFSDKYKSYCEKFYILSDNENNLSNYMSAFENAICFLVNHSVLTAVNRKKYKVPRPVSNEYHMPDPSQEFKLAFKNFYNLVYTDQLFSHLKIYSLPYHIINIQFARIKTWQEFDNFFSFLMEKKVIIYLFVKVKVSFRLFFNRPKALKSKLETLKNHYGHGCAITKFATSIIIKISSSQNNSYFFEEQNQCNDLVEEQR